MQTVTEQLLEIIRSYERSTGSRPSRISISSGLYCCLVDEDWNNPEIFHCYDGGVPMFDGIETRVDPFLSESDTTATIKLFGYEKEYAVQIPQKEEKA